MNCPINLFPFEWLTKSEVVAILHRANKELLDLESGLPTTRAYDGCTHLEATYNEENNTYFIIEYWESFEKYDAYLDWRLNDDPSGAADEIFKYLVGGRNGLVTNTNNIGYKFY